MDVTFLFLDESIAFGAAWLNGVFVPAQRHAHVRDAILRIAQTALTAAGHEFLRPTELHGVDLLRDVQGVTDEQRIKVFDDVADLINREALQTVSIGHLDSKDVRQNLARLNMDPGDKMYSLNFRELVDKLALANDSMIVPVFDGGGRRAASKKELRVDHFAYEAFIRGAYETHWHRVVAEDKPPGLLVYKPNLHNLGEPTFSDSSQSPLLQLADVVGYMLMAAMQEGASTMSEFKSRVAASGKRIQPELIFRREIRTQFVAPLETAGPNAS